MIKLVALDIDGTLARNDRTLSAATIETLAETQRQGVRLVIASGRPTYGIAPIADALGLAKHGGFVLAYNGGEIWNWQTKERLYAHTLPDDVITLLHNSCKEAGFAMMTYCGSQIVTEASSNPYISLSSARNKMEILVVKDFLKDAKRPLSKCMIVGEAEPLHQFEQTLTDQLAGRANAYRSEPFYLEVVPTGIDKAQCLRFLLKKLGMTRDELMAVGDGYNDISMIQLAGMGVAMGNAQPCVKEAADYITLSNEADGVADAVRRLVLR